MPSAQGEQSRAAYALLTRWELRGRPIGYGPRARVRGKARDYERGSAQSPADSDCSMTALLRMALLTVTCDRRNLSTASNPHRGTNVAPNRAGRKLLPFLITGADCPNGDGREDGEQREPQRQNPLDHYSPSPEREACIHARRRKARSQPRTRPVATPATKVSIGEKLPCGGRDQQVA